MTMPAKAATTAPPPRKFTVTEYHRMGEAGIFHPEERVELIDGVIMLKAPPAVIPAPRKFTVAEYYRMAEAGILHPDERVELIEGEIIVMAPIGNHHAAWVAQIIELFLSKALGTLTLWSQSSLPLSDGSTPEPDIVLLRRREDFYFGSRPSPEDILLVIEVSDTTLNYDRNVKVPLYAGNNVPETWLMNLEANCIEVYREPGAQGYQQSLILHRGDTIAPQALPDITLNVADILPPVAEEPAGNC